MSEHPADVWVARQGRRRTTLPDHYTPSTTLLMTQAMRESYANAMRLMAAPSILFKVFEPDPWDEAVKAIERIHAARAEWPWPVC